MRKELEVGKKAGARFHVRSLIKLLKKVPSKAQRLRRAFAGCSLKFPDLCDSGFCGRIWIFLFFFGLGSSVFFCLMDL